EICALNLFPKLKGSKDPFPIASNTSDAAAFGGEPAFAGYTPNSSAFGRVRTKPKLVSLAVEEGANRIGAVDAYWIGNGDASLTQCLFRRKGVLHLQRNAGI